jgi:glycosyltransferase involved in cell wall biosynthesis
MDIFTAMVLLVILILVLNLLYWGLLFTRLAFYREKNIPDQLEETDRKPVQLILCVRNEGENLRRFLPLLMNQSHPDYRVLVIDDHSADDTPEILEEYRKRFPGLTVMTNVRHLGKKRSMQQAIEASDRPVLAFTDGDCQPVSNHWLNLITSRIDRGKSVVLGYAPFFRKSTGVNLFARFECVMTATQYFSYALAGIPYMGVGRNLSYTQSLFDQYGGFIDHLDKVSGDDDLFVNRAANRNNTAVQLDPRSFVYSAAPDSWRQFFRQKRRHISTSPRYRRFHQLLLGFFAATQLLFYLALPFTGFPMGLLLWFIRMLLIYPVAYRIFRKLDAPDLILFFPLLDILLALYYVVLSILAIFPPRNTW